MGPFNVARKTWFKREKEVIPAFLHAEKCRLLCQLRAQSVRHADILRLKVFDDDREGATVVCGIESYVDENAGWRATNDTEFDTDKHRILWMIIKQAVLTAIDTAEQRLSTSRLSTSSSQIFKRQELETDHELSCMRKLVGHFGLPMCIPATARRSTT